MNGLHRLPSKVQVTHSPWSTHTVGNTTHPEKICTQISSSSRPISLDYSRTNCQCRTNCLQSLICPEFPLQLPECCKGDPSGKQADALGVGRFRGECEAEGTIWKCHTPLHTPTDTSNQRPHLCVLPQWSLLHCFAN